LWARGGIFWVKLGIVGYSWVNLDILGKMGGRGVSAEKLGSFRVERGKWEYFGENGVEGDKVEGFK